jgi:DNA mismatch endonuclease (patch repair protein)
MTDILTTTERSQRMRQVRSSGNRSTELAIRAALRRARVHGWRRHVRVALGEGPKQGSNAMPYARPDFVFAAARLAVFIDGCFWHGCPWHGTQPKARGQIWKEKLVRNRRRDRDVMRRLERRGWTVVRIWEHDVKKRINYCVDRIRNALLSCRPPSRVRKTHGRKVSS